MGYLSIEQSTVPDFTKAVISLWFRVPQASIDNFLAAPLTPLVNTIIPLVTFGVPGHQEIINLNFTEYGFVPIQDVLGAIFNVPVGANNLPVDVGPQPIDPSYIGLEVSSNALNVVVNLQTNTRATLTNYLLVATGAANIASPGDYLWQPTGYEDISASQTGMPESYSISISVADPSKFADVWHHLLIACDLSNDISTTGAATIPDGVISYNLLWAALDDVNYNGYDAFPYWPGAPANVNATLTQMTLAVAANGTPSVENIGLVASPVADPDQPGGFVTTVNLTTLSTGSPITVTALLPPTPIPINGGPLGIPASAEFASSIFKVEMAEFQMFTGVSLDTSVEANRRAFIAKGADGSLTPVNPFAIGSLADPTAGVDANTLIAPGTPQKLLGKPPDIALISSSFNWMGGINTGTAAKAGGKFKATGTIKPFLPNPKVGS